jgi:hypothetical protein
MGSTTQSTNLTPSTYVGPTSGTPLYFAPVTSSGAYFNVGDASKVLIFVSNGSSSETGSTLAAVFLEPGARWAGSRGLAPSTTSTLYSTATAPIACYVAANGKSGSTAAISTTGSFVVMGPYDSATIKSSDEKIYLVASTGSSQMAAAVFAMPGGSTQ